MKAEVNYLKDETVEIDLNVDQCHIVLNDKKGDEEVIKQEMKKTVVKVCPFQLK